VDEVGIVARMILVVVEPLAIEQLGNVEMFGMVRAFRRKAAGASLLNAIAVISRNGRQGGCG
jgi:hypothetical protein